MINSNLMNEIMKEFWNDLYDFRFPKYHRLKKKVIFNFYFSFALRLINLFQISDKRFLEMVRTSKKNIDCGSIISMLRLNLLISRLNWIDISKRIEKWHDFLHFLFHWSFDLQNVHLPSTMKSFILRYVTTISSQVQLI